MCEDHVRFLPFQSAFQTQILPPYIFFPDGQDFTEILYVAFEDAFYGYIACQNIEIVRKDIAVNIICVMCTTEPSRTSSKTFLFPWLPLHYDEILTSLLDCVTSYDVQSNPAADYAPYKSNTHAKYCVFAAYLRTREYCDESRVKFTSRRMTH